MPPELAEASPDPLVLASASPRRQELLRNAQIPFLVQAANIPEEHRAGESPEQYVRRLAREKAQAIANSLQTGNCILGADTEVVLDVKSGTPLGKPKHEKDAARMLRLLSGHNHYVITGVCLMWRTPPEEKWHVVEDSEATLVHMQPISEREIAEYVVTGEPMDKAGAYAIQGIASRWISRIEGCYFNVVGLPIPLVFRLLKEHRRQQGTSRPVKE